jgi:hypothetical protein
MYSTVQTVHHGLLNRVGQSQVYTPPLFSLRLPPEISVSVDPAYGEPAISLHSHHVSLVQWTTRFLPVMRDPGSNPQGGTYVKPGSSC